MVALQHPAVVTRINNEMNKEPPFPQKLFTASIAAILEPSYKFPLTVE
jgi:hypothetical protein